MKDLLLKFWNWLGFAFWVKIVTGDPQCTYYFGPFFSYQQAIAAQPGYLDDLQEEGAQGIQVQIQRIKPVELTIFSEGDQGFLPTRTAFS